MHNHAYTHTHTHTHTRADIHIRAERDPPHEHPIVRCGSNTVGFRLMYRFSTEKVTRRDAAMAAREETVNVRALALSPPSMSEPALPAAFVCHLPLRARQFSVCITFVQEKIVLAVHADSFEETVCA